MLYESLGKLFYKSPAEYEQIYLHRFRNEASLHFDFQIHGNIAFLLTNFEMLHIMEQIWQQDKQLSLICSHLPHIAKQQYVTWATIEEIKLTNEIEGIHSSREEIELLIDDRLPMKNKKRLQDFVRQYRALMNRSEIDLSDCTALRRLYDELCLFAVTSEDPINRPDGILFRKEAVAVLSETQKELHQGLYPERAITEAMTKALYILNDTRIPVLLRIPIFHYLFAYIHPFYDGNGRLDRFISSYFLSRNFQPLLGYNLSYTIKQELPAYYRLFKETNDSRNRGDLTPFVLGFLQLILHSAESLNRQLWRRYQKMTVCEAQLHRLYPAQDRYFRVLHVLMLNTLFGYRCMDSHELATAAGLSEATVRAVLRELCATTCLIQVEQNESSKRFGVNLAALLLASPPPLPDFKKENHEMELSDQ